MSTVSKSSTGLVARPVSAGPVPKTEGNSEAESPVSRDKPSILLRYGSMLPVFGGLIEIGYGVKEMRQGIKPQEIKDGKVDIFRGATATVSGACIPFISLAPLKILPTFSPTILAGLGMLGGVAIMANVLFDGGRDVYNGIKGLKTGDPRAKSDILWGSVKLGAGALVAAGCFLVTPAVLWAGGAAYGAAACLQNRKQVLEGLHQTRDTVAKVAHSVAEHLHLHKTSEVVQS